MSDRSLQKGECVLIEIVHGEQGDWMVDEHHAEEEAARLLRDLVAIDNDAFESKGSTGYGSHADVCGIRNSFIRRWSRLDAVSVEPNTD